MKQWRKRAEDVLKYVLDHGYSGSIRIGAISTIGIGSEGMESGRVTRIIGMMTEEKREIMSVP